MARKVRSDSFHARLTPAERLEFFRRVGTMSLQEGVVFAREKYGLSCTVNTLSRAMQAWLRSDESAFAELVSCNVERARAIADSAPISPVDAANSLNAIGVNKLMSMDAEVRQEGLRYVTVARSLLAAASEADKLRLARERFEAAEKRLDAARETVVDAKLTPEEREQKLKEIFGL